MGEGNVMTWACMTASGIISLNFIDDGTHDGGSRTNSEVYGNIRPIDREMHPMESGGNSSCSKTTVK